MAFENLPDIRHPYTEYTLADAVDLAVKHAETFSHEVPKTLEEVREYIRGMSANAGHTWLTGAAAQDVLNAAIDGKNIRDDFRF